MYAPGGLVTDLDGIGRRIPDTILHRGRMDEIAVLASCVPFKSFKHDGGDAEGVLVVNVCIDG